MLFMVGIERPHEDNNAWGIVVPAFEKLGYVCVSAADEKEEILYRAKAAILTLAEEVIEDGHRLATLKEEWTDYSDEYPEFSEWLALEVPVEGLTGRQKRINITMSEPMLARVDTFVSFHHEFKDRSDFLAQAAEKLMQTD